MCREGVVLRKGCGWRLKGIRDSDSVKVLFISNGSTMGVGVVGNEFAGAMGLGGCRKAKLEVVEVGGVVVLQLHDMYLHIHAVTAIGKAEGASCRLLSLGIEPELALWNLIVDTGVVFI